MLRCVISYFSQEEQDDSSEVVPQLHGDNIYRLHGDSVFRHKSVDDDITFGSLLGGTDTAFVFDR